MKSVSQRSEATFDYSGAHVLVTGGTGGIGAAIAAAYQAAGALVTITGTKEAVARPKDGPAPHQYLQLDIEKAEQIDRVAAALPQLDVLVNCAGIALPSIGQNEYKPEVFERALNMHLAGFYRLANACAPKLSKSTLSGGASIIGIASMASFFGIEMVPGYGAAKAGVVQLVKTLAVHWGRQNIRVNAVAPGLTESRMTAPMFQKPEYAAPTLARTPLGRLGKPEDIAGAVLFLSSSSARHITGQTLPIDGGYTVYG